MIISTSNATLDVPSIRHCLFLIKLHASARNFIQKDTLAQVLSCEFCKSFKNSWLAETVAGQEN